jgi:hypothetical protein
LVSQRIRKRHIRNLAQRPAVDGGPIPGVRHPTSHGNTQTGHYSSPPNTAQNLFYAANISGQIELTICRLNMPCDDLSTLDFGRSRFCAAKIHGKSV